MKRTLLLLRHAKSSWKDESRPDHDRPLNARGKRDALRVGPLLHEENLVPDLILTSTARRARKTVKRISAELPDLEIVKRDDLYLADVELFFEVMREVSEQMQRLMIVGHNPGLEELLFALTRKETALPTCALAVIELDASSWSKVDSNLPGHLRRIWRPREGWAGS